ncbi:hypothetical protein GIW70_09060 [Pseudomonas syringae]|nr:hypothetical protein [Pseudomonas syringae]MCF5068344.1 hypothetical protein [Pseudomonas syringae]
MSSTLAAKAFQSTSISQQLRLNAQKSDAIERQMIVRELKAATANRPDDQLINWEEHDLELQAGSSLHQVHTPGQILLNELLATVAGQSMLTQESIQNRGLACVSHTGEFEVLGAAGWIDVAAYFSYGSVYPARLAVLVDIAKETGETLWSVNAIDIQQWLKFHGFVIPRTIAEGRNMIEFMQCVFPQADRFGNYWGQLFADEQALIVLSAEQRQAIRRVTTTLLPLNKKLLDVLCVETAVAIITHDNARERLQHLIEHPVAQGYARKYLAALDWYGAATEADLSPQELGQVLITAILLDLNPFIGQAKGRTSVGSFDLYSPTYVERPASVVREDLQAYCVANQWVSLGVAPLATHLLLARIAPEFLVRQVPTDLLLGSVGWVAFCKAVALVDAVSSGVSRFMTYAQIMAYAELEPVSPSLSHMHGMAMIDPIVDWALINGVETRQALAEDEKAATERAIAAYLAHAQSLNQVASVYARAIPDRRAIALAALKDEVPACDMLEEKVLFQKPGLYASPSAMSMVDLHMSGDLTGQQWDFRPVWPDSTTPDLNGSISGQNRPTLHDPSVKSLYTRYPAVKWLKANDDEFHRQLREYLGNLDNALTTSLKLAIAQMIAYDLEAFLKSDITFFTLRGSAAVVRSTPIGGPLIREEMVESQQGRDAATGRYGIVMCATYRGVVTCYELFTLRGEARKNSALGQLIGQSGKLHEPSRIDFDGDVTVNGAPTPLERLPINLKCYTHGIADRFSSATSMAVIEKLGVLPAPSTPSVVHQSVYRNVMDPQVARMAHFIVKHRPLMKFDELKVAATDPTELELERDRGERTATYIVDLAVPFKKCIEDIATGEHDRVVDGVYGCVMDGIALAGTFAGAAGKALSITTKTVSTMSKAASLARLAIGTSLSVFNPLDDIPAVLQGAGKMVYKGGLRFGQQAQDMLALARSQLDHLNGGRKSLITAADSAHIGQGKWTPHGSAVDTMTVLAARRDFQWYALDRHGKPWGKTLNNFTFVSPARFPRPDKTLPVSYTRTLIERCLPVAQTKIDNAISAMTRHDFAEERRFVIRMLMGSSSADVTDRLLKYLKLVKTDFAGLSLSNFLLDPFKDSGSIAAFNVDLYTQWKANGNDVAFIEVFTPNLNSHFMSHGLNNGVVADDLIHELFHGITKESDVGYASDAQVGGAQGQKLDVAPLLNLATGFLHITDDGATPNYHASSKTFENADSLAVTATLLSQLFTDKNAYLENMTIMSQAVSANRNRAITSPVVITLNKV